MAWPGEPTGSATLANPRPASLPALASSSGAGESRRISADPHAPAGGVRAGGCGVPSPAGRVQVGGTVAGARAGRGGTGAVPLCSVSLAQVCWPWAT